MKRMGLVLLGAMLFLNGCGSIETQPAAAGTDASTAGAGAHPTNTMAAAPTIVPTATQTKAPSLTLTPLAEGRVVIQETNGLPVTGTLYGRGETAVILASVGGMSESQWGFFAKDLAQHGFTALAVSSPESQGDTVVLVRQAIEFLRANGYRRIVCAGASNGASGCAYNLQYPEISGLLLITYHGAANLSKIALPKLFVAGASADPWKETTQAGFEAAGEPKELILVPDTSGNGPSILEIDPAIKKQVLEFLKACNGLQ